MNSGVKLQNVRIFIAKSAKKQFLLTNFGVIPSILGVSGLELHFSGTKPVTFFGTQTSLGGTIFVWAGTSSDLGGTAPKCPPWRRAWLRHNMEWNRNFGMEYGKCQNGMEWKTLRMEWKTIFHTFMLIPKVVIISLKLFHRKLSS